MQIVDLSDDSLERVVGLGWIPDTPDHRDYMLTLPPMVAELPSKVDLREYDSEIFDQGSLGSCTGQATSGAYMFNLKKQGKPFFIPSRLFIYYNGRKALGTINQDSGAMLRDCIKSVNVDGVCDEPIWPHTITEFKKKPSREAYKKAQNHQSVSYSRVPRSLDSFKSCLAAGLPFVFGFAVYESFMTRDVAKTGMMKWPSKDEKSYGGHAVVAVGYDDNLEGGRFIVRNSWGEKWGDKGYFYMPYEYLTGKGLADDFWVIQTVE
jgi:C1A family cysteine protease